MSWLRRTLRKGGVWLFVERLWRSVKYEEVYLRAYDTVSDARASIGRYIAFYNSEHPHSQLGYRLPREYIASIKPAECPV
ncbi:transposase InsO family protein [Bradyrhizobium sp. USDA 3311]